MRKALLLVSILSISVFSTACINNFAVQELNNKAKASLEQGDYKTAIERLKSSIDLDDTVFESHYNLAVAYTQAEDYVNAIANYKKAIELKPDFADSYYSLAVADESLAVSIEAGDVIVSDSGEIAPAPENVQAGDDEVAIDTIKTLSPVAEKLKNDILTDAVANYNKYLEVAESPADAEEIKNKVQQLNDKLAASAPQQLAAQGAEQ